jgi:light-regulated signal transduction histidine kinase (bacteriophytochrome)
MMPAQPERRGNAPQSAPAAAPYIDEQAVAQAAASEITQFAHAAAHDVKAPLRHITAYCNLLSEDFSAKLGEDGVKHLKRILVNTARLQRLVEDLVAYAEAFDSAEKKQSVDAHGAAAAALERLADEIRASGATVELGALPVVTAGPRGLEQVFRQLIANAVSYRSPDRALRIAISGGEAEGAFLFRVSDNGPGIPHEHRITIFEPFRRLHSRDEIEGSGLGLSACARIIAKHGGRLWVEDSPGGGATFCFTLPKE